MKIKNAMLAATCGFALTTMTYAQEPAVGTIIDITGSSAFRTAVDATLVSLMGPTGRSAYLSGTNITRSNAVRGIYKGQINSVQYTIRTSWSGSGAGVVALADQANVSFLVTGTTTTLSSGGGDAQAGPATESVPAEFAFSDVAQAAAGRPNTAFGGGAVGVTPFVFVAGEGTPSGVTNMTDQQHNYIWNNGEAFARLLSGDNADAGHTLLPTGRSASSGTRILTLSETRFGRLATVIQNNSVGSTATTLTGETSSLGNGGLADGGVVATLLGKTPNPGAANAPYSFISYLVVPDALAAEANGARILTYNGVAYSEANVQTGKYTLWGAQQMYRKVGASAGEIAFDAQLRTNIGANLGTAGIALNSMLVDRLGGDGGSIVEQ